MSTLLRRAAGPMIAFGILGSLIVGPSWAGALQSLVHEGPGPAKTAVDYTSTGGSTVQHCSGDVCSVAVTTPLNVTTPASGSSYRAHVTVSVDYNAVGPSSTYFALDLAAYHPGTPGGLTTFPDKRYVSAGKSSTTVDFWVPNLQPGKTYAFSLNPKVGPTAPGGSSTQYMKTYRVLTRVDLLPAS